MQVVTLDLLRDACQLSPPLGLAALAAGVMLWLCGWWSHRFWVVLFATVLAGLYGLVQAPLLHAPPLPTAVLMALSAGVLALALIRVIVFVAAGLALVLLTQEFWPGLNQPTLVFLVSGLVGHFLFRICLTALTATAGAVLMTYAGLMLLNGYGGQDVIAWVERTPALCIWVGGLLAVVGFAGQVYWHRRATRRREEEEEEGVSRFPRLWPWSSAERDAA